MIGSVYTFYRKRIQSRNRRYILLLLVLVKFKTFGIKVACVYFSTLVISTVYTVYTKKHVHFYYNSSRFCISLFYSFQCVRNLFKEWYVTSILYMRQYPLNILFTSNTKISHLHFSLLLVVKENERMYRSIEAETNEILSYVCLRQANVSQTECFCPNNCVPCSTSTVQFICFISVDYLWHNRGHIFPMFHSV